MEFINLMLSNILNIGIFVFIISKLFQPKIPKKYIYLFFLLEFLCLCVVNSLHYFSFNTLFILLVNTILLFICYRGKNILKLYITAVYVCFGIILEMFVFMFIHYLFSIGFELITIDSPYYLLGTLCTSLLLFLVMSLFKKFLVSLSNTQYPKKTLLLLCLPITSVLFLANLKNLNQIFINNNITIIFIFIGLLISNILSFYIFFDIIKIVQENSKIKLRESHHKIDELNYQLLESKYDNTRSFVHDIKKHLTIINQLLVADEYEELNLYIQDMYSEIEKTDYTIVTSQKILNIVINQKISLLKENDIKLKLDIEDIDMSFISLYGQNIIYGNLIENAVESCLKISGNKNIILRLKADDQYIILRLINSCSKAIFLEGIPQTLKEDKINHGFGLTKIKDIVEEHNGRIIYQFNKDLQTFCTSIIFSK